MRTKIVVWLLGTAIVATAGVALPQVPKPSGITPPGLPTRVLPSVADVAALRAQKSLTPQQKAAIVNAGLKTPAQPSMEGPVTLSVTNMLAMQNGVATAALSFHQPTFVAGAHDLSGGPLAYAALKAGTESAAIVQIKAAGDKMYLVDCNVAGPGSVAFRVEIDFATEIASATVTPQANHATVVVQKQGAPKNVDIWITGTRTGGAPGWLFSSCEITPYQ